MTTEEEEEERKGTFPWSSFVFLRLDGRKASGDEQTAAFRYIVGKEGGGDLR